MATLPCVAVASRGDDRGRAEAILQELAQRPAERAVVAEPIAHAEDALRRSADALGGGDSNHAGLLNALGLEWAETARDLARAAKAEATLTSTQRRVSETEEKLSRAKALLDDTVARRGRAQQKLESLKAQPDGGAP